MAKLNWGIVGGGEGSHSALTPIAPTVTGVKCLKVNATAPTALIWSQSQHPTQPTLKSPKDFLKQASTCCVKNP